MGTLSVFRKVLAVLFATALLLGITGPLLPRLAAQGTTPGALLLDVNGTINSIKEGYIARAIERAQEDRLELVIIRLDTPGGLLDSTRKIVEELLESPVPVVVYVAPRGAQAGSAGTFITAAANFAVMAPGTNIGAATPISSTGEDLGETLASKATNDAAALIRSIAQERGRNQDKLEETVRQASSYTAREAVDLNVVDFIAEDLDDLLALLNGQTATTPLGTRTINTDDIEVREFNKTLVEHFLEFISDPNVSFILLTIGGLGIVIELFNFGMIFPGVVGIICLLLAFLALGNLPVNWAGVAFIFLAVALAVLETQVSGFGVLGVGAIVSLVVGGFLLFNQFGDTSPTLAPVSVSYWVIGGTTGVLALIFLYLLREIYRSRKEGNQPSRPSLVGQTGLVTTELAPRGVVQVGNDTWSAVSEDGSVIPAGESIQVVFVDGLMLHVSRRQPANETFQRH